MFPTNGYLPTKLGITIYFSELLLRDIKKMIVWRSKYLAQFRFNYALTRTVVSHLLYFSVFTDLLRVGLYFVQLL